LEKEAWSVEEDMARSSISKLGFLQIQFKLLVHVNQLERASRSSVTRFHQNILGALSGEISPHPLGIRLK
jgi:hypothetical protein